MRFVVDRIGVVPVPGLHHLLQQPGSLLTLVLELAPQPELDDSVDSLVLVVSHEVVVDAGEDDSNALRPCDPAKHEVFLAAGHFGADQLHAVEQIHLVGRIVVDLFISVVLDDTHDDFSNGFAPELLVLLQLLRVVFPKFAVRLNTQSILPRLLDNPIAINRRELEFTKTARNDRLDSSGLLSLWQIHKFSQRFESGEVQFSVNPELAAALLDLLSTYFLMELS